MQRDLTPNQLRLIEESILGQLNEKDQAMFDHNLQEDSYFREEYEFHIDLTKALHYQDHSDFKKILHTIEATRATSTDKRTSTWQFWAAAAAFLFITGFIVVTQLWSTSPSDLVAVYFEPQTNIHNPITRSGVNSDLQTEAFLAYDSQEWDKASVLFDSLARIEPKSAFDLYRANLLMLQKKYDSAIPILEQFNKSDDPYSDRALWYLALSHLGLGNKESTLQYLDLLIQNQSHPLKEAQELRDIITAQ